MREGLQSMRLCVLEERDECVGKNCVGEPAAQWERSPVKDLHPLLSGELGGNTDQERRGARGILRPHMRLKPRHLRVSSDQRRLPK